MKFKKYLIEKSYTDDDWVLVDSGKVVKYIKNPKNDKAPSSFTKSKGQEMVRISKAKQMGIMEGKKWTGKTEKKRKVSMGQDKSGMYSGEIFDEYGDVESGTTKKTKQEVDKWFSEHGIKKIKWNK